MSDLGKFILDTGLTVSTKNHPVVLESVGGPLLIVMVAEGDDKSRKATTSVAVFCDNDGAWIMAAN